MTPHVAQLLSLSPPDAARPAPTDWDSVEQRLGVQVPAEVREIADVYGSSLIGGEFRIFHEDGPGESLVDAYENWIEDLPELWDLRDCALPATAPKKMPHLLPWFTTEWGECGFAVVDASSDPDAWRSVLVNEEYSIFEFHDLSPGHLLAALVAGDLETQCLRCVTGEA